MRDDGVMSGLMSELLASSATRIRIGAANREKAERDFDQSVMFAAWRDLWTGAA